MLFASYLTLRTSVLTVPIFGILRHDRVGILRGRWRVLWHTLPFESNKPLSSNIKQILRTEQPNSRETGTAERLVKLSTGNYEMCSSG